MRAVLGFVRIDITAHGWFIHHQDGPGPRVRSDGQTVRCRGQRLKPWFFCGLPEQRDMFSNVCWFISSRNYSCKQLVRFFRTRSHSDIGVVCTNLLSYRKRGPHMLPHTLTNLENHLVYAAGTYYLLSKHHML